MDLRGFGLSDDDLRQLGYDVGRRSDAGRASARGPSGSGAGGEGPARESAARKRWAPATRMWVASLLVLVAAGWASGTARWLPRPVAVAAPDTAFSSGRAMAQLVEVVQGPRSTGSPEHERAWTYLVSRLRSLGLETEVQTATSFVRDSALVRAATVRNVVARLPGTASTGAIMLTAHYDTRPHSPGAGDGAMGVATLLEVARALAAGPPLRNDVVFLLADGEELGRLGSGAFWASHEAARDVAIVLSAEGRGGSGPAIWFETGPDNGRLVQMLAGLESRPTALSLSRSVRAIALESAASDPQRPEGVRALAFATLGGAALQHQQRDLRELVSETSLQHAGRQLLALTGSLGGLDLRSQLAAPDRVFTSLPRVGAVHYPRLWVLPTSLALLALWALCGLVLRGRRARWLGIAVGTGAASLTVLAAAAAARALRDGAAGWHPERGALSTAFYEDGAYVLAVVALAVACGSVLYAVAKRWARSDELVFGGLLLPVLYAAWLSFAEPFAAPALQLPLAAALLGGALVIVLGPRRARTVWAWGALLPLGAATLVLAVPAVDLLAAAWTFREAPRIGAVAGLGVLLLWPLMERLLMPRPWWTPLAAVGAAAALVTVTLPVTRDPSEHPVPSTLVYLTDTPVVDPLASLAVAAGHDSARTRSMAGRWLTVSGPGEEWARSWAGEPAHGSIDAGTLLIGADDRFEVIGTGPVTELAPPRASLVASVDEGASRRVELAVRPGLSGEMTGVHIPDGSPGALVGVGDAFWDGQAAPVRGLVHWGAPATPELRVHVRVAPGDTELVVEVLEHHLRPHEVLRGSFFQRPDSLVRDAATGGDRAIQRTRLRVPLEEIATP